MSAEACSVKMYEERREALKDMASLGADFVPVVGDIKSFAEAQRRLITLWLQSVSFLAREMRQARSSGQQKRR